MRCVICGDPDPDISDGRCMDCISAGIAQREAYAEQDNAIRAATQEPAGSGALTVEQEHAQWHEQNGVTEPGSPRKVGEDGAQVTLETVFDEEHQESKWRNAVAEQLNTLLTRAKYCADTTNDESDKDVERATLAIVERVATFEHIRPSSAPVGEQKQEEGV